MSDICIIIPARYASTRYPGKPLATLKGANGVKRSLIERTILAAQATSQGAIPIYVATDDDRIAAEATRLGTDVIMTDETCQNGTERVAQAVDRAGIGADIIVNLQGDAPLTPPHFITDLIAAMRADPSAQIATPCLQCDAETVKNLLVDRSQGRVGATTVVFNVHKDALYFSKEVLPFTNGQGVVDGVVPVFHHVGIYAYRPAALTAYGTWPAGPLERLEGLEQLRFLENGHPIRMVQVHAPGAKFWELNNPSDVPLIEGYLAQTGVD